MVITCSNLACDKYMMNECYYELANMTQVCNFGRNFTFIITHLHSYSIDVVAFYFITIIITSQCLLYTFH